MSATNRVGIVMVEDSPHDRESAPRASKNSNSANCIQVARDGAEAMGSIFGEGTHAGRRREDDPQVIAPDLKLPKADGLEVLRRINREPRTRTIPVGVLTWSNEQRDVEESCSLGVNSYIFKPVTFEQFAAVGQELGRYWLQLNRPPVIGG